VPGTNTIIGFQPRDVAGQITASVDVQSTEIGSAQIGSIMDTLDNITGKVTTNPFDNWNLLPFLFPPFLGVTTLGAGGAAGNLAIGTSPHDPLNTGAIYPCAVYGSDGSLFPFVRAAITKHPEMSFGPGEKLYGGIEISALGQLSINGNVGLPGMEGFLMSQSMTNPIGNPIQEPGANADPDATGFAVTSANFGQSHFTGAWNQWSNLEAESSWQLVPDIAYQTYSTQKISRVMKLTKARFAIKARLVGPTMTSLLSYILGTSGAGGFTSGGIMSQTNAGAFSTGAFNLVLTAANGARTITLVNCTPKMAPFSWGGTQLRVGEIMFIQTLVVAGTAASPSLIFSS
jgi:hypothetical protein